MDNNITGKTAQPEPDMDGNDWRTQLPAGSRQRIINKIKNTLELGEIAGPDELLELGEIAVRYEENYYVTATSQSDYLRKISMKLRTLKSKSQTRGDATSLPQNSAGGTQYPQDSEIEHTAQTGNTDAADWQEEIYQKIKSMKETYFVELAQMYQNICLNFEYESLAQQPDEHIAEIHIMKIMIERLMAVLLMSKVSVTHCHGEKMLNFEKILVHSIQSFRQQLSQPQVPPQLDNQMSRLAQAINLHYVLSMQPTSVTGLPTIQSINMKSLQPGPTLETGRIDTSNSLQPGDAPMQLNTLDAAHQANINTSHSGVNGVEPNVLQLQQIKQQQLTRQLMLQQQVLQQHILQQQQQQQQLNTLDAAHQARQMLEPHRMNEALKTRHGKGFAPGMKTVQQLTTGAQFPISSSPSCQYSSPQSDDQSLLTPLVKSGIPSLSSNSSSVVPSPSTLLAPSQLPGESKIQVSGVFPLSKALATTAQPRAQPLSIDSPAVPFLAEFILFCLIFTILVFYSLC